MLSVWVIRLQPSLSTCKLPSKLPQDGLNSSPSWLLNLWKRILPRFLVNISAGFSVPGMNISSICLFAMHSYMCYNFISTCVEHYFFFFIYYLHAFTLIISGTCSYSSLFISDQTCVCLSLFISTWTCNYLYFFIHAFALLVTCVDLTFYLPSTWGLIVYKPVDTWLYSLAYSLIIYLGLYLVTF